MIVFFNEYNDIVIIDIVERRTIRFYDSVYRADGSNPNEFYGVWIILE